MKSELMHIEGKGLCIVISDIDFHAMIKEDRVVTSETFKDPFIIAKLLREGKLISAIKEVRAQTNVDLKTAKAYIERYLNPRTFNNRTDKDFKEAAEAFLDEHTTSIYKLK